jgi:hypothetical protein
MVKHFSLAFLNSGQANFARVTNLAGSKSFLERRKADLGIILKGAGDKTGHISDSEAYAAKVALGGNAGNIAGVAGRKKH